ncbi:hypothetical protein IMY05_001G0197500 [Salix suchowensis]|nr:hypothetical protein IMY05_001G0197500 [Salix suchowensis]
MDHGPPYFPVQRHNMLEPLYAHLPLALHEKMKVMKPSNSSVDSVIFAALKICCCTVHQFMAKQNV